jgi:1,4-alpha-glucan branching enzyme
LQRWVKDLNRLYREQGALHELDFDASGFEWVDCNDMMHSVVSFIRRGRRNDDAVLIVCNFTPVPRFNYRVGVPHLGFWRELLNSDAIEYGGSGCGNLGGTEAIPAPWHGHPYSLSIVLPPLGILFFKNEIRGLSLP